MWHKVKGFTNKYILISSSHRLLQSWRAHLGPGTAAPSVPPLLAVLPLFQLHHLQIFLIDFNWIDWLQFFEVAVFESSSSS